MLSLDGRFAVDDDDVAVAVAGDGERRARALLDGGGVGSDILGSTEECEADCKEAGSLCEEEFEEDWGLGEDDLEDDGSADLAEPVAAVAEDAALDAAAEDDEPSAAPALPLLGCDDLGGAMAGGCGWRWRREEVLLWWKSKWENGVGREKKERK